MIVFHWVSETGGQDRVHLCREITESQPPGGDPLRRHGHHRLGRTLTDAERIFGRHHRGDPLPHLLRDGLGRCLYPRGLWHFAIGCQKVSAEQVSSVAEREKLEAALEYVREGDILVLTKLDRLARSVSHLVAIGERLKAKSVALRVLDHTDETRVNPALSMDERPKRS